MFRHTAFFFIVSQVPKNGQQRRLKRAGEGAITLDKDGERIGPRGVDHVSLGVKCVLAVATMRKVSLGLCPTQCSTQGRKMHGKMILDIYKIWHGGRF